MLKTQKPVYVGCSVGGSGEAGPGAGETVEEEMSVVRACVGGVVELVGRSREVEGREGGNG